MLWSSSHLTGTVRLIADSTADAARINLLAKLCSRQVNLEPGSKLATFVGPCYSGRDSKNPTS